METDNKKDACPDDVSLYDLLLTLKRRWFIILVVTFVSTGLAFSYTILAKKVYRVHNILVINQMIDGDLFSQAELSETVSILDKINKQGDLDKDKILKIKGMREKDLMAVSEIKVSEIKGSNSLWVDIDTSEGEIGVALMESLPDFALSIPAISNRLKMQKELMLKNREDLKTIIDNPVTNIRLTRDSVVYLPSIDLYTLREKYNRINALLEKMENGPLVYLAWKTELPKVHFKPRKTKIILVGLVIGVFLGILVSFIMEWKEKAQRRPNDR